MRLLGTATRAVHEHCREFVNVEAVVNPLNVIICMLQVK